MTPTQYQTISAKLDAIDAKLDVALIQQARHDEQIKVLQKGTGGALALALTLVGAWVRNKLHL